LVFDVGRVADRPAERRQMLAEAPGFGPLSGPSAAPGLSSWTRKAKRPGGAIWKRQ
jgi:hypothetical protein